MGKFKLQTNWQLPCLTVNRKTYLLKWKRKEEESAETRRKCEDKVTGNRTKRRSLVNYIQISTMISCLLKQNSSCSFSE